MYNPVLMIDFYKATHAEQYPKNINYADIQSKDIFVQ